MIQKNLLKILFVEDIPSDVDLAVIELRKEKIEFEYATICTRIDMVSALKKFNPDLIISDYMMPSFTGLLALKEAKEFNSEIPFILYTGSVNEETAVACLKAGAQDYIIKEHMTRLPYAVKEAVEQVGRNKEKRASELLLKENEEKLQSIFSAAPVGIGLVVDRVFIEVNDTFCNMTGYTRRELIGKSSEIIYSSREEFIKAGEEKYRQIAEKGTGSVETSFKCKDGKLLNVLLSVAPLDINDHSKGITFTLLDITARKRAEVALYESEERYKFANRATFNIIWDWNLQSNSLWWNDNFKTHFGYNAEEIEPGIESWTNRIHPEDLNRVETGIHRAIDTGQDYWTDQYRFLKKNGTYAEIEDRGYIARDASNHPLRMTGAMQDITEHKRADAAQRESEEKYRRIFENVQDLYYETSINGTILEISPSIEILSKGQYRRDDLIGKSVYDFYPDPVERAVLISNLKEHGRVLDFEITLKNKDGSQVPCSVSSKICLNELGYPEKMIGSIRDITDRKNASDALQLAKEKAETSDRLKTEFLNNISHEVRTPLNGILGFAEIISVKNLSEEDKKNSLRMLFESSNRLLNTITNYMDISLITSGSLSVNKRDFFPSKILRRVYNNFEPFCLNRNLKLLLEIPGRTVRRLFNKF